MKSVFFIIKVLIIHINETDQQFKRIEIINGWLAAYCLLALNSYRSNVLIEELDIAIEKFDVVQMKIIGSLFWNLTFVSQNSHVCWFNIQLM